MSADNESHPSTHQKTLTIDSTTVHSDEYPGFVKTTPPRGLKIDTDCDSCLDEDLIPQTHTHRTLVLCFDGTGDQFDEDNSNVVNFFSMLKKDDPKQQLVYYQAGIGTYTIPQIAKPMMAKVHRALDAMIGVHLDAHVMSGYEFLMENYEAGDKINIFGFSRGAYTARALAGMIHKVGLLPKSNHQQVPFAYKMYSRKDEVGWRQSTAFKKAFSIDVDIELLGLWETVGSVGMIPRRLPFTTSNTHVKYFRHALALDEHRVRFMPNFWNRPTHEELQLGLQRGEMPRPKQHREKSLRDLEQQYTQGGDHFTDVEEVWFAGCHCDVGGGAVKNPFRHKLARIPLRWMVRQCFLLKTGILFHREMFKVIGIDPDTLHPVVIPRPPPVRQLSGVQRVEYKLLPPGARGKTVVDIESDYVSEEEEDLADAMSQMNDMLKIAKTWWILEFIPQNLRFQLDDDSWTQQMLVNKGRGRTIPRQHVGGMKVHRSVKLRMEAEGMNYKPRTEWDVEPTWVD